MKILQEYREFSLSEPTKEYLTNKLAEGMSKKKCIFPENNKFSYLCEVKKYLKTVLN